MADSIETISLPRRVYHRVAPQATRDWVNEQINAQRLWRATVRWSLTPPAMRRRWVHRKLNLDHSQWLFLIGMNNSGTTLLNRLLGLHPHIRELGSEGQRLTRALPRPWHYELGRLWSHKLDAFRWTETDDPSPALRCMFDWTYHYPFGAGYLLEKSPPNAVRSRWLQANFQPSRFICITRHPGAVCEGIIRRRPEYTMEDAARHWSVAHAVLLSDMPHLRKVLRITYEQLSEDTLSVLREIEEFLELPQPFDRSLIAHEFSVHNMDDQPAIIQNFNQRSIARLTASDIETINRVAGEMMAQLDYEPLRLPDDAPRAEVCADHGST